jgi:hypothetical protein
MINAKIKKNKFNIPWNIFTYYKVFLDFFILSRLLIGTLMESTSSRQINLPQHFSHSMKYDLLKTDEPMRLFTAPHLLREELMAISILSSCSI